MTTAEKRRKHEPLAVRQAVSSHQVSASARKNSTIFIRLR